MAKAWKRILTEIDVGVLIASHTDLSSLRDDFTEHALENGIGGHIPAAGTAGQFLAHNGQWAVPVGTTYTNGTGLSLTGNSFAHIPHTGDVTGATALTISANAVTLAKMAKISTKGVIGNNTATNVDPVLLTFAQVKSELGLVKSDVGLGSVDNTADSAKNVLSATKWTTSRTLSTTGDATGSTTGVDGSGNISVALTIPANTITLAKMAKIATKGVLGNNTGASNEPALLTFAQVKTELALTKSDVGLGNVDNIADINKDVNTALMLKNPRTISVSGDATGGIAFDGSANVAIPLTLANSGVTASTYKSVTVDAKGRVTAGTNPTTLSGYGITDAVRKTSVTNATLPTPTTEAEGEILLYKSASGVTAIPYICLDILP